MPDIFEGLKVIIRKLTELGMILVSVAIVIQVIFGPGQFFPDVAVNIVELVRSVSGHGLVGLITISIVVWLFAGRQP